MRAARSSEPKLQREFRRRRGGDAQYALQKQIPKNVTVPYTWRVHGQLRESRIVVEADTYALFLQKFTSEEAACQTLREWALELHVLAGGKAREERLRKEILHRVYRAIFSKLEHEECAFVESDQPLAQRVKRVDDHQPVKVESIRYTWQVEGKLAGASFNIDAALYKAFIKLFTSPDVARRTLREWAIEINVLAGGRAEMSLVVERMRERVSNAIAAGPGHSELGEPLAEVE
ncbi:MULTISPECIES: hypothetical protein [Herbaspirillum]|uniref:Uncharacterized protein n=2 Tax=Herbaspirillum huttiense TaxID=863372 RepID=A0AAJ2HAP0_9BURK|nr:MULTISPECIES: hypothetical protein [Herbaspirillum]MDR9836996.1 hypothetical protein [Herbaspirillum huttiense]